MELQDIAVNSRISGLSPDGYVTIKSVEALGADSAARIYVDQQGGLGARLVSRRDAESLSLADQSNLPSLGADANEFKLAAEASRISASPTSTIRCSQ